jgi:hypothetical protein
MTTLFCCTGVPASRILRGIFLAGFLVVMLMLGSVPRALAADTNTIKSITNVPGAGIDITLTSTRAFEVRDDILTLQIGSNTYTLSRLPADGDTGTVIFTLTPTEFAATSTGQTVTVYYGSGSPTDGNAWSFSTLDKGLLK